VTTSEFPRKPDDAALLRLARAVLAEETDFSVSAEQVRLALTFGLQAGFECNTDRAVAGLGAFISDLVALGGPRDQASMVVAFRGWYGDREDQAGLHEYGCATGDTGRWLEARMADLARVLWDGGSAVRAENGLPTCPLFTS
jgi:hypothetical protein